AIRQLQPEEYSEVNLDPPLCCPGAGFHFLRRPHLSEVIAHVFTSLREVNLAALGLAWRLDFHWRLNQPADATPRLRQINITLLAHF
ncbi:hypothetical protein, partial [Synechococcus sp. 1G10]|uniref:hypothetical protein n=1 Tax=Synechococcus sp. 1G10 TaxID=2025605 RepID=UPI001E33351D